MERSEWVGRFRERLAELIAREGVSRAAFAQRIGLDRSTLSQLLSSENARLPRAETIAAIARETQVSADWLLGLSQTGRPGTELVPETLQVETGLTAHVFDPELLRERREVLGKSGHPVNFIASFDGTDIPPDHVIFDIDPAEKLPVAIMTSPAMRIWPDDIHSSPSVSFFPFYSRLW